MLICEQLMLTNIISFFFFFSLHLLYLLIYILFLFVGGGFCLFACFCCCCCFLFVCLFFLIFKICSSSIPCKVSLVKSLYEDCSWLQFTRIHKQLQWHNLKHKLSGCKRQKETSGASHFRPLLPIQRGLA